MRAPGRLRRGGYASCEDAAQARAGVLAGPPEETAAEAWTVARWLRFWLAHHQRLRPSTQLACAGHIRRYLIPYLGRVTLAELTSADVMRLVLALSAQRTCYGEALTPATLHRIRATLRAALNAAIRAGLIGENAARHVELPRPRRPHPVVWTERRVAAWRQSGERPAVAVWTTTPLAVFLRSVRTDRMYALWWPIALRGLRRGDAAGLRWIDLDLDARLLTVERQLVQVGKEVIIGQPKSAASQRTIAIDKATARLLREHEQQRESDRDRCGERWHEAGYVFRWPDGLPLRPDYLTSRFAFLARKAGLPPSRLHDLRHGAASIAAGTDLKVVQETLGPSSIVLTCDTYTSVLPEIAHRSAEATARLVLAAARKLPDDL